jgi:hypothetical protein
MSDKKSSLNPDWGTPAKVEMLADQLQKDENVRAADRALVDALANGSPPWSADEAQKFQIQLNINWLELTTKLQGAIGQINNAFIPNGNYFSCFSESGNVTKKDKWGATFTKEINKILKKGKSGKRNHFTLRSRNASVALHGVGALLWTNSTRLLPKFVPLEDLLIPTNTLLDFSTNLTEFFVNLYLTPGELFRMACTGKKDPGWNQTAVHKVLSDMKDEANTPYFSQSISQWTERPEALQELWKQNQGFLECAAVPKARLRAFYYQKVDDQKWYRKIILRDSTPSLEKGQEFIYDGPTAFSDDIDNIIQCQFGDNSLIAPLQFHSVRGIGTLLYGPCFTSNRLRCQFIQHTFVNLLTFWRITDPVDRDRLKAILLLQHGIIPEGASVVPNNERHQIDPRLVEFSMAQLRQNIGENSSSYTPSADTGTRKERTAFEVKAQLQSSSAMVSNVLSMMYQQEIYLYEELVRRALLPNTDDPTAKRFQEACLKAGIPQKLMVPDNWRIVPERVLGAGDGMLAQAQADALMSQRQTFEPESQRKIQRLWTSTLLDDPERAQELVPEAPDQSTSGTRAAEDLYGTLMRGIAVPMRKGIDYVGYCAALLQMMEVEISSTMQQGEDAMGTPEQLKGFVTVAQSIEQNIQFLSQNEENKPIVKQLQDKLTALLNEVKGIAQRQAQAAGAQQQQPDPEAMAKAQTMTMLAQVKATISQATAAQKMQLKQQQFDQKQRQQAAKHEQDLTSKGAQLGASLATQRAQTEQELAANRALTTSELMAKGARTGADVAAVKIKAKAKPANGGGE